MMEYWRCPALAHSMIFHKEEIEWYYNFALITTAKKTKPPKNSPMYKQMNGVVPRWHDVLLILHVWQKWRGLTLDL